MKKLFLLFSLVVLVSVVSFGNVNQYRVNDTQIESMFAQAEQVSLPASLDAQGVDMQGFEAISPIVTDVARKSDKNAWVAFAICWGVGALGIHRLYLGTNPWVVVGYICSGGGCGVVLTVDWVVLLIGAINNDISDYVDNNAFFMWL